MLRRVGIVGLILCSCVNPYREPQNVSSTESKVKQASFDQVLKGLRSSLDSERQDSIQQIHQLGSQAIDPLVLLLTDLVHDQSPRFPAGREEEGAIALNKYLKEPESVDFAERLGQLAINQRLMEDIVRLLGDLRAEAAAPILIEIMNRNVPGLPAPEISSLRRIGSGAVPELVKDLDESQIRAYGFERIVYGWRIHWDDVSRGRNFDRPSTELRRSDRERAELGRITRIRLKVIQILGEVGDPRAIPPLERLLSATQDHSLISAIRAAMGQIEQPDTRLVPAPARPPK